MNRPVVSVCSVAVAAIVSLGPCASAADDSPLPSTVAWFEWVHQIDDADAGEPSEPAVADGVVYYGDRRPAIVALDAATGGVLWETTSKRFGDSEETVGRFYPPCIGPERVFVGGESQLAALSRSTGEVLWTQPLPAGCSQRAIARLPTALVVADYGGEVTGRDPATGQVLWTASLMDDVPPDPPGFDGEKARFTGILARPRDARAVGSLCVIGVFDQSRVVAVETEGDDAGTIVWSYEAGGWVSVPLRVEGDSVYVASQGRRVAKLDAATGQERWRAETTGWNTSQPVPAGSVVYAAIPKGRLLTLDAETGQAGQPFTLPSQPKYAIGPPIVTEETLIALVGREIVSLDRATGETGWSLAVGANEKPRGPLKQSAGRLILRIGNYGDQKRHAVAAIGGD